MKDFDTWNKNKKSMQERQERISFHDRDVWWCSLGVNIGDEQDGKGDEFVRPVLILKKFSKHTALIIPLSSKIKSGKYYVRMRL